MSEQAELLKARTMRFSLDVCGLLKQLPYDEPGPTVRRQLDKIFNKRRLQLSRFLPCALARGVHVQDRLGGGRSRRNSGLAGIHRSGGTDRFSGVDTTAKRSHRVVGDHVGVCWHSALQGAQQTPLRPDHPIPQSNYPITRLPDYPITRFTVCLSSSHTPAPRHLRCAGRKRERCADTRRGIRSGSDSRRSRPSAARRPRDR